MLSEPDGGFTFDGSTGKLVTTGYACGMSKTHPSTTMSADKFLSDPAAGRKMLVDHLKAARASGNKIGGWHNPANGGTIILDQVQVFPNSAAGRSNAIKLAKAEGEISIAHHDAITAGDWDNAIIPTGGSGNLDTADQRGRLDTHGHHQDPAVRDRADEAPLGDDRRGDREARRRDVRLDGEAGARSPAGDQQELIALLERIESRHGHHNQKTHGHRLHGALSDDLAKGVVKLFGSDAFGKANRKMKKKELKKLLKQGRGQTVTFKMDKKQARALAGIEWRSSAGGDRAELDGAGDGDRRGAGGAGRADARRRGGGSEGVDQRGLIALLDRIESRRYNAAQPRDADGKWTSGGGVGIDVSRGALGTGHRSPELGDMSEKAQALALGVINAVPGMENITTVEEAAREIEARLEAVVDEALARGFTVEQAQASAQWYDVANDYATQMATEAGLNHPETAAAVIAALSPSAEWEGNLTNAQVVCEKVGKNAVTTEADVDLALGRQISAAEYALSQAKKPDQIAKLEDKVAELKDPATRAKLAERMVGKKFNDLDADDQVAVVNGTVQGKGMHGVKLTPHPDGSYDVGDDGHLVRVQSAANVKKALLIAQADKRGAGPDEMSEVISKHVSQDSKVRAFFTNIAHPNDTKQSAITIDTHAWSSSLTPVNALTSKKMFAGSKEVGFAKAYPLVRDAMTKLGPKLAAKIGVEKLSPRQVQSITWEMTRHLYPQGGKGTALKGKKEGEYIDTPAIRSAYAAGDHRKAVAIQVEMMGGPVRVDSYVTSEGVRVDAYTREQP